MLNAGRKENREQFIAQLTKGLSTINKEDIMTIAESYKMEGREEAIELMQKTRSLLREGQTVSQVAQSTGLPQAVVETLQ